MAKVTVFGLGGSGTSTLAKTFSKKYGYVYKSTGDMFREKAASLGMEVSEFAKFCKEHGDKYDKELDSDVEKYGKGNDNFIFESRLAWYFIPDSIKVKIDCDYDVRLKRLQERDGGDFQSILDKAVQREESDKQRYNDFYGIEDYSDESHYDLILDSTSNSPEELTDKIKEFIDKN